MKTSPAVSVVIPAYNAARYVHRAVDSVLAQTFTDLEVLVVDDGSVDGTAGAVEIRYPHVTVLRQVNAGPAAARNRGLRHVRGRYVAFLDADDHWEPAKLARQVDLLEANPEVGFCSTATRVVDATGNTVGDWPCCATSERLTELLFMHGSAVSGSTSGVLARSELVLACGGFDESLRGFEDPDLWIRLASRTAYACIPEALTVVVRTPDSVSTHLTRMRAATLGSLQKNRALLTKERRGTYWRSAYAGALTDYAKMAWRAGDRGRALAWTVEALARAPVSRGRLCTSLLVAMVTGGTL